MNLDHLLSYLQSLPADTAWPHTWAGWRIERIAGGMNNLVYRATAAGADLAIKLTRRDARDRAGREYAALQLLADLGVDLAPRPVLLARDRYTQPVIVQQWLDGVVHAAPPADDAEWLALIRFYAALHTATAGQTERVQPAVVNIAQVAQGRAMIAEQIGMLPAAEQPADLIELNRRLATLDIPEPPGRRTALCRVDSNILNFIRRPTGWASVDWENSGWGEPAFEVVDLMTHPAYLAVPAARWEALIAQYARLSDDPYAPEKIATFLPLMLIWWVARNARSLYELPRGLDQRLSGDSEAMLQTIRQNQASYIQAAHQSLDRLRPSVG
jgi:aminoglycoside phosphotransferase (APT) family kinase protein